MAGYSLGDADLLRRAMGKKDAARWPGRSRRFVVRRGERNNIDRDKATEIFDLLAKFAEYGFNKSHSAAYGYIGYQTAWLKAHHRAEFMAVVDDDRRRATPTRSSPTSADCRSAGIRILPVCVNASVRAFDALPPAADVPKGQIRVGLSAVKGVGDAAIEAIVEARTAAGGRFKDVIEFFERVDHRRINKKVIEVLVKAGAFDFLGVTRAAMLWRPRSDASGEETRGPDTMERAMQAAARAQEDRLAGQHSLFGGGSAVAKPVFKFPDVPEWSLAKRLANEKEVLGLYLSGHPMEGHTADVKRHRATPIRDVGNVPGDVEVRVIGILSAEPVVRKSARGDKWAAVRLEDQHGTVRAVFFADAWARSQRAVETAFDKGEPIFVTGRARSGQDGVEIRANTAETLADVRSRSTTEVRFIVGIGDLDGDRLERFYTILRSRHGSCRSRLVVRSPERYDVELDLPGLPVDPVSALEDAVNALFGRSDAVVFH